MFQNKLQRTELTPGIKDALEKRLSAKEMEFTLENVHHSNFAGVRAELKRFGFFCSNFELVLNAWMETRRAKYVWKYIHLFS